MVVGEDSLCCSLGERLVSSFLPEWRLAGPSIDTKGRTKLAPKMVSYLEQARHVQPVLCIADTDGECPALLHRSWLCRPIDQLLLRFAVVEAESWLLADRKGLADALKVPLSGIPREPDAEGDPKRVILNLSRKSTNRTVREELVSPSNPSRAGTGYGFHLSQFVRHKWNPVVAAEASPSLARAIRRLEGFAA